MKQLTTANDCRMIAHQFASMNEESFKSIFTAYRKRVFGYALDLTRSKYAAEEITQTVFIKLWLCRDTLDRVENLDGYIFSMTHNRTLNYLRKESHDAHLIASSYLSPGSRNDNNVEERLINYDYGRLIGEAVENLSPQRKIVYELSRAKGLNNDEIAAYLQLSRNTVRNHLAEALRCIRNYLITKGSIGILACSWIFF